MSKFDQRKYEREAPGYLTYPPDIEGGAWCLICCFALLLSMILKAPIYPRTLNSLLKRNDGYTNGAEIIYSVIKRLFRIDMQLDFYHGKKKNPELVIAPAIISYDIIPGDDYNSHFVLVISTDYKNDKLKGFLIYDPLIDRTKYISRNKLNDFICTIINIKT